jgi:hypothetical protein
LTHIKVRMTPTGICVRIRPLWPRARAATRAGRGESRTPYWGRTERRRGRPEKALALRAQSCTTWGRPGATGLIFLPNVLLKALMPGA